MYVKAIGELWNFIPNKVANLIRILYNFQYIAK